MNTSVVYRAGGVSKRYGNVVVLDDVNFEARKGEVHALLGANGAGKSTLVKILAGVIKPSAGRLQLDDVAIDFSSQREAVAAGVATVSQELNLFPELTVLENLFVMREPRRLLLANHRQMRRAATPVLDTVGLSASLLSHPLRALSLGSRQLVEIARALLESPRVLILDEPTSALKAAETRRLLETVRGLRDDGVSVVFVSHFLEDVFQVSDVVTILRSGRVVEPSASIDTLTPERTVAMMLGEAASPDEDSKEAAASFPIAPATDVQPLRIRDASVRGALHAFSLQAQPGEVVGLAGLEGSGASETLKMLFGAMAHTRGEITLPSGRPAARDIATAVRRGVAYIPADRKADGLILEQPVYENLTAVISGPLRRLGLLPSRASKIARAKAWQPAVSLSMSSAAIPVGSLSGGNQQKVVFAKWLETEPSLVLLDDPTRGVDVGAKADMMKIVRAVAQSGRVVLYTSTDLAEMAELCDRVVVFYRRSTVGELSPPFTEHGLLNAVTAGDLGGAAAATSPAPGLVRAFESGPTP